jgi:RNA polymerase sigma-70 factor (ECF subfamily)
MAVSQELVATSEMSLIPFYFSKVERMSENEFVGQLIDLEYSLQKFALRLTQKKEDVKDLVQETCLRVLMNRDKYINNDNFKAWTFTIMKNTFINEYRHSFRKLTCTDSTIDFSFFDKAGHLVSDGPDSAYSVMEITQHIEQLETKFRVPFKMHTQGFKYKEIAEKLNLTIGTVKSRIFLSRKQLMYQLNR